MTIYQKPNGAIFAAEAKTGEIADFPDVKRGWGITIEQTDRKPPMSWMNGLNKQIFQNLEYLRQNGIAPYDDQLEYPKGALTQVNGIIYQAINATKDNHPEKSSKNWKQLIEEASESVAGITKVINATDRDSTTSALSASMGKKLQDEKLDKNVANIMLTRAAPSGEIAYFALENAPDGWLKANGATVSRKEYANLFAVIDTKYGKGDGETTFNIPDFRGEFFRALDDGRNVDANRKLGSYQGDAIRNITGGSPVGDGKGWLANSSLYNNERLGAVKINGTGNRVILGNGSSQGSNWFFWDFDASRVVPTAHENRPRNIALLACIKA